MSYALASLLAILSYLLNMQSGLFNHPPKSAEKVNLSYVYADSPNLAFPYILVLFEGGT